MQFQRQARPRPPDAARSLPSPHILLLALAALLVALAVSACVHTAGFEQPTLVRVVDASYAAPAVNVSIESSLLAANLGQGAITPYGTLTPSPVAIVAITATSGGAGLIRTTAALLAGQRSSIFLSDNAAAPGGYQVALLQDQQVAAPSGHSSVRFLNQAIKTGAIDVYLVPAGATVANTIPIAADLQVGSSPAYTSFASQTVTLVITPAGLTKPAYTSAPLALTGGEVRTVLIVNTQLTSNPPLIAFIASDVN